MTFVVPFILGEDGEAALMEHVQKDDEIIDTNDILKEIREIITLAGEEIKKSESLQE